MEILDRQKLFKSRDLNSNLAQKSTRGGIATIGAQSMQFILNVGSTAVLARLLTPADYGLIGMVTVVINFMQMFKEAGLSMATIQRDEISHEQISTLFWINVLISVILGGCIFASAPLVASFYGNPKLAAITAVLSVPFVLSGLLIQHRALLRRHMQFGELAVIQVVSQVVSVVAMVALACVGWRYWALVWGLLVRALADVLLTFFFCRWVPGKMRKRTGARDMLFFGGHLTGFNFINYFSRNADNILIGKFIGTDALGLYVKAYSLFMMPITQIRGPITNVAMPALSSLKDQPERYAKYYQQIIEIIGLLAVPLTLYCAIEAEFLIRLLLGVQWLGAVPVFRILAFAGLVQVGMGTCGLVLISSGFSKRYLIWGICVGVVSVISFIVGIPFGIIGVATSYVVATYLIFIPSLYFCFYQTPILVSQFLKTLVRPLINGAIAVIAVLLLEERMSAESFLSHVFCAFLFGGTYVSLSLFYGPFRNTASLIIKSIMSKGSSRR